MIAIALLVVTFTLGVAFTPRQREIPQDRRRRWHVRAPK